MATLYSSLRLQISGPMCILKNKPHPQSGPFLLLKKGALLSGGYSINVWLLPKGIHNTVWTTTFVPQEAYMYILVHKEVQYYTALTYANLCQDSWWLAIISECYNYTGVIRSMEQATCTNNIDFPIGWDNIAISPCMLMMSKLNDTHRWQDNPAQVMKVQGK